MKINVLLISKLESNLAAMRRMIQDEEIAILGESSGGSKALDKIENTSPDIVIMMLGAEDPDVLSLTERIILHRPRTHVILLAEYLDLEILQSAIKVGAHNVTTFPANPKEFAEYIKSVHNNETTRINSLNAKQNITWMSRVITVFGAKGGLGKTTIAANLAVKLASLQKKVALVDLDLQFGDAHIFLDIEPMDTIIELIQQAGTPTIDAIRSYMTVHSSGVHVLCAPKSPEYAELVSAEKVQALLGVLRTYYDYVIIDTSPMFTEVTINAIEASTTILFVTGLDISILKNSRLSMTLLESLQQKDKIKVIINRAVDISSINVNDVQKIIDCPIWAKIPSDYKVAVTALNRGVPFVLSAPASKLSQAISDISNILLSDKLEYQIHASDKKQIRIPGLFKKRFGLSKSLSQ
jgi:pilus assembly protein CpaE